MGRWSGRTQEVVPVVFGLLHLSLGAVEEAVLLGGFLVLATDTHGSAMIDCRTLWARGDADATKVRCCFERVQSVKSYDREDVACEDRTAV